jgi:hypothetical protein
LDSMGFSPRRSFEIYRWNLNLSDQVHTTYYVTEDNMIQVGTNTIKGWMDKNCLPTETRTTTAKSGAAGELI